MVAEIKSNGRLRIAALGGMNANNGESENVRIYTRGGKVFEGTLQLVNASIHVNGDYSETQRDLTAPKSLLTSASKMPTMCALWGLKRAI